MSETSFIRRRWKLILNILTFGVLVILIITIRDQLAQTFSNLSRVQVWALLLIIPIEALNYHAQTRMYQYLFQTVGNKLSYKNLFKLSLELNFVNHVFPSGGVSGISYFGLRLRSFNVRAGQAALIQLMKLVLIFVSFEVLLILGMLILSISGKASNLIILIAGSVSTLLVVGTLIFTYIIGSKRRINSFFVTLTKGLNRVVRTVRPKQPEAININRAHILFDELHENYMLFKHQYKELKAPFWYALLANATEVAVVYVVFLAFGNWVNVGAIILAYAVANFAGLISILPGGIGIYEALMTAVMVSAGVPAAVSIPAIIMFRMLSMAVQIPPGYVLYHRNLSRKSEPEPTDEP